MAEDEALIAIVVVIAVAGLVLGIVAVTTNQTFSHMVGGGPMGPGGTETATSPAPGGLEWGVLLASVTLFAGSVALLLRARRRSRATTAGSGPELPPFGGNSTHSVPTSPGALQAPPAASSRSSSAVSVPGPASERSLLRLLNEDERRMYLEIRDHGGQMLQKDLVALGIFSKAKVTRLLDKLEAKGLVVREPHGMTNRVRIVPPKGP